MRFDKDGFCENIKAFNGFFQSIVQPGFPEDFSDWWNWQAKTLLGFLVKWFFISLFVFVGFFGWLSFFVFVALLKFLLWLILLFPVAFFIFLYSVKFKENVSRDQVQ